MGLLLMDSLETVFLITVGTLTRVQNYHGPWPGALYWLLKQDYEDLCDKSF